MAATAITSSSISFFIFSSTSSSTMFLVSFFFFTFSLLSFAILILYPPKKSPHTQLLPHDDSQLPNYPPPSPFPDPTNQTHFPHSLLQILPPNDPGRPGPGIINDKEMGDSECGKTKKKKKKRVRKKRCNDIDEGAERGDVKEEDQELVCFYPFTTSSSATQRKIKQQYDELVKSHESCGLTLAQVGHFVNVLVEARNELQHKSGVIRRKFSITKALLFKADRSSFDRLRQQIYKLELEQQRLEEDAFVYNWLQQQLKLSPAYKKMLEIGTCMELKAETSKLEDSKDAGFADISFEELLAQEKKDSFWQKNGKPRTCAGR